MEPQSSKEQSPDDEAADVEEKSRPILHRVLLMAHKVQTEMLDRIETVLIDKTVTDRTLIRKTQIHKMKLHELSMKPILIIGISGKIHKDDRSIVISELEILIHDEPEIHERAPQQ